MVALTNKKLYSDKDLSVYTNIYFLAFIRKKFMTSDLREELREETKRGETHWKETLENIR
jgi:hypothetical protein